MLFNSFEFFVFFMVVTPLYFLLPFKFRWALLLLASSIFYMFFIPEYILILFFTIVIDYFAGIWIEQSEGAKRKQYLVLSLIANVGVLCVFKYYNFFIDNFNFVGSIFADQNGQILPHWKIILPIGLSFHTFQAMSYTIEVYRGNQKAEYHFGIYALYVMFYPQLVAGPIERPQNVLHQFHEEHTFDYDNVLQGLNQIFYGLFKKIVVADRLAFYVNAVYADIEHASSISILLAMIFFSFQIYCDFSGYSEIALGTARIMGYNLMTNFNRPYLAQNISEFWARWHISLSTWFRDYLYIPLGGNRVGKWRWYFNLSMVFLVSGFWHGASWTYVVWGMLHAIYQILWLISVNFRKKLAEITGFHQLTQINNLLSSLITFAAVTVAWVFFRAENFTKANAIFSKLAEMNFHWNSDQVFGGKGSFNFILSFLALGLLFLSYKLPKDLKLGKYSLLFAVAAVVLITLFGKSSNEQFIYFQF